MKKARKTKRDRLVSAPNALELLQRDHADLITIFNEFQELVDAGAPPEDKAVLVKRGCTEFIMHSKIEEEIFYPALRRATGANTLIDSAEVEHENARDLVHEMLDMMPDEAMYDAKFLVLGDHMTRHFKDEEDRIFKAAQRAVSLPLDLLGIEMEERKMEMREQMALAETDFGEINLTGSHAKGVLTRHGLLP